MIKRLGVALWWLGAIAGALIAVVTVGSVASDGADPGHIAIAACFALPVPLVCWALVYVLCGTFLKPPKV
jgi:hypothetical protein